MCSFVLHLLYFFLFGSLVFVSHGSMLPSEICTVFCGCLKGFSMTSAATKIWHQKRTHIACESPLVLSHLPCTKSYPFMIKKLQTKTKIWKKNQLKRLWCVVCWSNGGFVCGCIFCQREFSKLSHVSYFNFDGWALRVAKFNASSTLEEKVGVDLKKCALEGFGTILYL